MPTILVVDDDDGVRGALCLLLRVFGHDVRGFADGAAFLAAAADYERACVILDLSMPNMDGAQVLRELRSRGVAHPVVFLTGHGCDEAAALPAALGVVSVLSKPCHAQELLAALDRALDFGQ